jgi:hypothetical protein
MIYKKKKGGGNHNTIFELKIETTKLHTGSGGEGITFYPIVSVN